MRHRKAYHNSLRKKIDDMANNRPALGSFYSVEDAAEAIGMTDNGLRTWIRLRKIEYVKIGRRVMIPERALLKLVEAGIVPARDEAAKATSTEEK